MNDLPTPHEPLRLADGTLINPVTRQAIRDVAPRVVAVPRAVDAQRIVARTRRKLSDLPAPPRTTNALGIVLSYTLVGLSDEDIAIACNITVEQVERIKSTAAYRELEQSVVKTVLEHDSGNVREYVARNARVAAERVTGLINSEDEQIALVAAKDVLDRAGHRPADVVEHRHKMEGGLTIEVIKRESVTDLPSIEKVEVE